MATQNEEEQNQKERKQRTKEKKTEADISTFTGASKMYAHIEAHLHTLSTLNCMIFAQIVD